MQAVCGDTVSVTVTVQREIDEEDSEEEKGETTVGKVICPRYGLEKTEAYWLVIGDSNSNALLSIKRISIGEKPSKVSPFTYIHTLSHCHLHCVLLYCPLHLISLLPTFYRPHSYPPYRTHSTIPPNFFLLQTKLEFTAPENPGDYKMVLYLISDSYLGCDQEYEINLTVLADEDDDA